MANTNWMKNNLTGNFNKDFATAIGVNQMQSITGSPTSNKLDLGLVASANPSLKPATNLSDKSSIFNTGQAFALTTGALGIMGNAMQNRSQTKALRAQATAYEAQMPLNYEAYRTQVGYMAEENFYNVSRIYDEYSTFAGEQRAAIAASGFDMSAGEQRVIKDTEQKMQNAMYLANRSTYLQSFELWRSTMLENARLKAAADIARSEAKYTKKMGKVNALAGMISTAAGVYAAGNYGRTRDVGVKGV